MNNDINTENSKDEALQKSKTNIRRVKLKFCIDKKKLDEMISKIDKRIQQLSNDQEK